MSFVSFRPYKHVAEWKIQSSCASLRIRSRVRNETLLSVPVSIFVSERFFKMRSRFRKRSGTFFEFAFPFPKAFQNQAHIVSGTLAFQFPTVFDHSECNELFIISLFITPLLPDIYGKSFNGICDSYFYQILYQTFV